MAEDGPSYPRATIAEVGGNRSGARRVRAVAGITLAALIIVTRQLWYLVREGRYRPDVWRRGNRWKERPEGTVEAMARPRAGYLAQTVFRHHEH